MDTARLSLVVGFGTDMGTSEEIAVALAASATAAGMPTEARELNAVSMAELADATHLAIVCSTFGEGELPDCALLFGEALDADDAPRLDHLRFAVLGLGDTSYEMFCNAGKVLDARLAALGGHRMLERVDVDGFPDEPAAAWSAELLGVLQAAAGTDASGATDPAAPLTERHTTIDARVLVNRLLTSPGSDREVRHYEIDLADTGLTYTAGDCLAVHAANDPELVAAVLAALGADHGGRIADRPEPLGVLLGEHLEIRTPSRALLALVASRTADAEAAATLRADGFAARGTWGHGRDVLDLLALADLGADEVVPTLRPLAPRDYSIASSPLAHPDSVHLTVATVRYDLDERRRGGVASTFLADRGEKVTVAPRRNTAFRLPAPDARVVMIGPGTGIAPFRAFLQERAVTGASGPTWLFTGFRRAADHLYADELADRVADGTLTRYDVAYSREDAPQPDGTRTYVQHRMREHAAELYRWLADGAYLYVCGDEASMARDVDAMVHEVVAVATGGDTEAAHAWVNDLRREHRYVRDVY